MWMRGDRTATATTGSTTTSIGPITAWARRHPLLAFVLVSYAVSWGCWVPLVLTGRIVRLGSSVSQFPGLLGPLVAAVLVTALTRGRPGVLDLARRAARWRVPVRWWLFAVGSPLALAGVALAVVAVGPGLPELGDFGRMAGLPEWGAAFVWVMFVVVNGLGEETGWRGYALPILRRRHGRLTASLLLVPIWAGWHLPLFFLLQSYRDLGPIGVPGFLIGLACGSIVLAWLYESAASSVLVAAVWHGTYNLTVATAAGSGTVAAVVSTGVMACAGVIVWRQRRSRAGAGGSAAEASCVGP
jgi:membrane protease YdiL (CAAX protease family)